VVHDPFGYFVARIDMGWSAWRVGVEYDGVQHWNDSRQRTRDIDRIAELEALGWRIVRVSSDMLRYRPNTIVDRAVAALRAAGHAPPNVKSCVTFR
jgi:very-short-patch-repair endonuclease